jgi:hypothetical protein
MEIRDTDHWFRKGIRPDPTNIIDGIHVEIDKSDDESANNPLAGLHFE